ncbi:hypothetical protein GCM10010468_35900 [Actinocorallia longicatena]|uniref:Uncharacterized protein n=1 Tax=Actinocorallia longicatena TaxID=111803 RepID=A0ABP6QCW7_9ACTN
MDALVSVNAPGGAPRSESPARGRPPVPAGIGIGGIGGDGQWKVKVAESTGVVAGHRKLPEIFEAENGPPV